MAVGKPGAAIVDARKFAGEIVEIGLLEAVGIAGKVEGPARETRARLLPDRWASRRDAGTAALPRTA